MVSQWEKPSEDISIGIRESSDLTCRSTRKRNPRLALPSPPIVDSDFPVREPISAQELIEQGLALLNIDKGMFDAKLNNVVDLIVPHRMNLTDDPYEVHQKWLEKRTDLVAEKLIFLINTDWLAQALDPKPLMTDGGLALHC